MAKKIKRTVPDKVADFLVAAICITCFVFGAIALLYALTDLIFFEGCINAFRRGFWGYMVFSVLFGAGIPTAEIFWKKYKRKIRRTKREKSRVMAAEFTRKERCHEGI